MKNKFYGICITSSEVNEESNVYLVTKNIFKDKWDATETCKGLNRAELEDGVKYIVIEMDVL